MIFPTIFAQEAELLIKENLSPIGPLMVEPLPLKTIILTTITFLVLAAIFVFVFPKVASHILGLSSILAFSAAATLGVLLPFTLYALRSSTTVILKAAPGSIPENIEVTNLTSKRFEILWKTKTPTVGVVRYGQDPADLQLFAVDVKGSEPTTDHRVMVTDLKPKTVYYFEVISGKLRFNEDGRPLVIETPE